MASHVEVNYYEVMGFAKGTSTRSISADDIKTAYRKCGRTSQLPASH